MTKREGERGREKGTDSQAIKNVTKVVGGVRVSEGRDLREKRERFK